MALRSIALNLSGAQFSDLFFNFEHPNRDRLYAPKNDEIDPDELHKALTEDAKEFLSIIGVDGTDRDEVAAELVADFEKRV